MINLLSRKILNIMNFMFQKHITGVYVSEKEIANKIKI